MFSESGLWAYDAIALALLAKHVEQVFNDLIWMLPCCKVATTVLVALVDNWTQCPSPGRWHNCQLLWAVTQPEFDLGDPFFSARTIDFAGVGCFVVNPQTGGWTSCGKVVDRYPGQDLIVLPLHATTRISLSMSQVQRGLSRGYTHRVLVSPVVELLVDPG